MNTKQNVTFIVQGPLHENLAKSMPIYQIYGQRIIVSCWSTCTVKNLSLIPQDIKYDLVCSEPPSAETIEAMSRLFLEPSQIGGGVFQMISVHAAFENVNIETEYVIKVRSDEIYTDWNSFFNKMQLCKGEKLITNNVFAFHSRFWRYHLSDHVFGCKTTIMRKMFKLIDKYLTLPNLLFINKKSITQPPPSYSYPNINETVRAFFEYVPGQIDNLHPEQIIGISFLMSKHIHDPIPAENHISKTTFDANIRDNYDIVHVSSMGDYCVSYKDGETRSFVTRTSGDSKYLRYKCLNDILDQNILEDQLDEFIYYARIGQYTFMKKDWVNALTHYQKIPESIQRSNATVLLNIGVCFFNMQRIKEALDYFYAAERSSPPNSSINDLAKRNIHVLQSCTNKCDSNLLD